jgi:hypothetical protein
MKGNIFSGSLPEVRLIDSCFPNPQDLSSPIMTPSPLINQEESKNPAVQSYENPKKIINESRRSTDGTITSLDSAVLILGNS